MKLEKELTMPQESHEAEQRGRLMIENDHGILMLDAAGHIANWNQGAEQLLGYTEADILGQPYARLFPSEAAGESAAQLKLAATGGRASDDHWHVRKDGSRFWCRGLVTALRDAHGKSQGFVAVLRDLTQEKQLQTALHDLRREADELAASSQRRDEFLAMLSHELRNPLASILIAVELLQCKDANHEAEAQARVTIERQVRHLARMIDDLLEVSRDTAGRVQLNLQPVELRSIVKRSVKASGHFIDEHRHHLSVSLPPAPVLTQADPDRLQQVIVNLLHNAAKYTNPGGKIALSLEKQQNQAVLRVRDNGIGIEPELLPNLFTLFLQGDGSLGRSQGGLGIGLSLVRTIVERHGGAVDACSAGAGLGSEFVVHLPIQSTSAYRFDAAECSCLRGPSAPNRSRGLNRLVRILMVEDQIDSAKCLAMLLRRSGHDVRIAHSGPAALEAAAEFQAEAVLLDIGLPGMNGYEVARRFRQSPLHHQVRLIALTGYGQESDRQRSREAGFDFHLVKPVGLRAIREVLSTPCNSWRIDSGGPPLANSQPHKEPGDDFQLSLQDWKLTLVASDPFRKSVRLGTPRRD